MSVKLIVPPDTRVSRNHLSEMVVGNALMFILSIF